ncbi:hypothetical protein K0U00_36715, partial [Paenibacillus sepulcri]|nr:hypothetical protein [Paenibacillus sepulcri]
MNIMAEEKTRIEPCWSFDNSYARLPGAFFSTLDAIPVRSPELVIFNEGLAVSLGLDSQAL